MSTATRLPLGLTTDLLVPELLQRHPEARAVLDRHGLLGCGGRLGPYETIDFFARAHGVDPRELLAELERAIAGAKAARRAGAEPAGSEAPSIADTIYRRYVLGALALTLTAGATWGAWMLWTIGRSGTFRAASLHQVNAHGEAQIFGWVGLFIMGFAYQACPRFWHTRLVAPRLAAWAFFLMVTGLVVRTVGMASAGRWGSALSWATAGGVLELVAVLIFISQLGATFVRSGLRLDPSAGFISVALAWFGVSTVMSIWHTWNTMSARSAEQLVWYVATYQAPLRDLQVHGLALFMILGVALRLLPALFDVPKVADRRAWWALGLLSAAVLGETGLFVAYRWTGRPALAAGLLLPWSLLAIGAGLIVLPWRPWRPFPRAERSAKFVRAAFGWLAVSLVMLLLMPAYHAASGLPFSHAYYGAIRHAITVGFTSLMMMGMAARFVPTLNGLDTGRLSTLWGPFLLLNLGCFLRVTTQTLTDWQPAAFAVVGLSGTLEVIGLAWWGAGLTRIILRGPAAPPPASGARPDRIEPGHRVSDVLEWFPESLTVFVSRGFTALRQPLLRRTMAHRVTVAQAAALGGVPADELLAALNARVTGGRQGG
jgi:hypothetical protein